jgi:hypothetical protein
MIVEENLSSKCKITINVRGDSSVRVHIEMKTNRKKSEVMRIYPQQLWEFWLPLDC